MIKMATKALFAELVANPTIKAAIRLEVRRVIMRANRNTIACPQCKGVGYVHQ